MKVVIDAVPPKPKPQKEVNIAVDFDGTLSVHEPGAGPEIGPAIPKMVQNVKDWLAQGYKVSIFTARLSRPEYAHQATEEITQFLIDNGLPVLPITCIKGFWFTHFVDDKAHHAPRNTGDIFPPLDFNE